MCKIQNSNENKISKKRFSKKIENFCCPIFLKKHSYDISLSDITPNATMTFIKYKNEVYGCTCKHVVEESIKNGKNGKPGAIQILSGIIIIDFNGFLTNPQNSMDFVSYPEFLIPNNGTDIAIRPLSLDWFNELLTQEKKLKYFDFDDYQKPDYENLKMLHAFGWLDNHKNIKNGKLSGLFTESIVELWRDINENSEDFVLFSELEEPHNLSFSGMSGGPVVYCDDESDITIPMGIIYEGSPGKNVEKSDSLLSNPNNILYQCLNLTPMKFSELLNDSDWIYKQDSKYKNFESWGKDPQIMVLNPAGPA